MKRARFRRRNLTARTSTPVPAQPGESLSLFLIMSNEIKVGDKVRVREDAPTSYLLRIKRNNLYAYYKVYDIEGNMAFINLYPKGLSLRDLTSDIVIPTKYLIKDDAEAKEAKYHKGDRVKFKNIYELQKVKDKSFRWMLVMFASKEATITAVEDNGFYRVDIDPSIGGINDDMIECKVEPTEQTEAERKPNVGSIKIPVEVELSDSYWDAYAADLAKEVALKVANKFNSPYVAAEYAVKVAKAVAEGLKRK